MERKNWPSPKTATATGISLKRVAVITAVELAVTIVLGTILAFVSFYR
ncbi:MAG: hypothetical protein WCP18_01600 [bacterium]